MENQKKELNLARKWRSKNFQEIIGQSLAVRILQNSLYLKQFFPVYLFAGQRGCGKTSTARIFAAAVNCQKLQDFQQDPRNVSIPCLSCESCLAMQAGKHPDFIEIDAASHTGVDNIRNIIDASSFLPLLSSKKIYLIDEAHMLSKAAFNAFLKILEEPPMSVIFILATTDVQKILETVKSRCFQIFFDPVSIDIITEHLEKLCIAEQIQYDVAGLSVIAQQAQGSVRDAINLLEQVRFATKKISQESVLSILGHIDDETLYKLFIKTVHNDIQDLLAFFTHLEKYEVSVEYLWSQLLDLTYDAILLQYQVTPRKFLYIPQAYKNIILDVQKERLMNLFDLLCHHEQQLGKTTKKLRFLEMTLLHHVQDQEHDSKKKIEHLNIDKQENKVVIVDQTVKWKRFVEKMQSLDDIVLVTMFQSSKYRAFDDEHKKLTVQFLKKFSLFADLLEKSKSSWYKDLYACFGQQVELVYTFDLVVQSLENHVQDRLTKTTLVNNQVQQSKNKNNSLQLDFSDANRWKIAQELLKQFGGTIVQISEDIHE
ncbi:MAG: DNA polymerase III subunit gamma/tau [Candidatus Chromulinivorax sp.]